MIHTLHWVISHNGDCRSTRPRKIESRFFFLIYSVYQNIPALFSPICVNVHYSVHVHMYIKHCFCYSSSICNTQKPARHETLQIYIKREFCKFAKIQCCQFVKRVFMNLKCGTNHKIQDHFMIMKFAGFIIQLHEMFINDYEDVYRILGLVNSKPTIGQTYSNFICQLRRCLPSHLPKPFHKKL